MFPNSSYPYPYFPSSSSSSPSPYPPFNFLNPENASTNNIFLHDPPPLPSVPYTNNTTNTHHHHAPPTCSETFTNWALADAMLKQENLTGGPHHHYSLSNFLTRKLPAAKKPAKKDRHSKIHTSQGLRDRRVRLSIEIARKFFDLQDMLGFDKASNTLEWLFSKSNKAIEELFRSKHSDNNNSTGACAADGDGDGDDDSFSSSSSEDEVVSVKRAQKEKEPSGVQAKMKESREKARARARERTSNKMCPETENPQMQLHQLSSEFQPHQELHRDDDFKVFEESIVIKRKLKQSLMSSSHHHQNQNIGIPKEASFNNNNNSECPSSFPMSPNWDASGATPRSNICAIASVNLSTGERVCVSVCVFHQEAANNMFGSI